MADTQTPPADSQSQDAGSGGDKGKLFFGKYKTIEEAENGYKELERGFHAKSQEASNWKSIADRGNSRPASTAPASSSSTDATGELTNLYSDPSGWKRRIKEETKRELREEQEAATRQYNDQVSRINSWGSRNQDLAGHGDLLETYVRRTDAKLELETRLDLAAQEVRKRLSELRGQGRTSEPDPATMDSAPGSNREGAPARPAAPAAPASPEAELASYASERNKSRMKRPGTHR